MAKTFGNTAKDASRIALPIAKAFVTQDITGTPKTSPLTVSTAVIPITLPTNCTQVMLYTPTNDVRISDIVGMSTYFVCVHGVPFLIDVAGMDTIYLVRDGASDAVTSLMFKTV
jgi:hypothetical protein